MNIVVTVLQVLLGLWNIIGGVYMSTHYEELINEWASGFFPSFFWIVFGVIQILFSLALILSVKKGKLSKMGLPAAIGLAVIDLVGIAFYMSYAGFPGMLWGLIPALLLGFVAYWRGLKK